MTPLREPWHSLAQNVHHTWVDCSKAAKSLAGTARAGAGSRPLCPECALLTEAARAIERARARARAGHAGLVSR